MNRGMRESRCIFLKGSTEWERHSPLTERVSTRATRSSQEQETESMIQGVLPSLSLVFIIMRRQACIRERDRDSRSAKKLLLHHKQPAYSASEREGKEEETGRRERKMKCIEQTVGLMSYFVSMGARIADARAGMQATHASPSSRG